MLTCPTPVHLGQALGQHRGGGVVHLARASVAEVSARIRIGESAGFTLR
jgi:hypothetical protein